LGWDSWLGVLKRFGAVASRPAGGQTIFKDKIGSIVNKHANSIVNKHASLMNSEGPRKTCPEVTRSRDSAFKIALIVDAITVRSTSLVSTDLTRLQTDLEISGRFFP